MRPAFVTVTGSIVPSPSLDLRFYAHSAVRVYRILGAHAAGQVSVSVNSSWDFTKPSDHRHIICFHHAFSCSRCQCFPAFNVAMAQTMPPAPEIQRTADNQLPSRIIRKCRYNHAAGRAL